MIFVNFKTYVESSGENAIKLVKLLEEAAHLTSLKIIPVVQTLDAESAVSATQSEVWIQHVDPISYGAHTGWTLPQEAVGIGIRGVFLNHSEHKFQDKESLANAVKMCKEVGLKTLIFADSIQELNKVLLLKPDFVSYEPPELVGSTDKSVATQKPEVIKEAADLSRNHSIPLIVGAGIHTSADVKTSMELGASGIAVATGVVKAPDPKKALLELALGFE